jgi:hypothetical protein
VRVFEQQNNTWVQKGSDINGDGVVIKFGQSVSLSADGNFIAIGQSGDPFQNNPEDTGRVKVYQYVGNQWQQVGNTIKSFIGKDEFGYTVSLSSQGNIVAIGTYGKGEVLVFELINGVWSQIGSSIFGNTQGDAFGFSLSLSADGSTLAAGARHLTLNNDQPGSAYVFKNEGGNWTIVGEPIVGVAAADQAGFSVALTADGSRVVVASTGNDEAGSNAGQVRIFQNAPAVGIDKEGNFDQVKIYPNPSEDRIQINSNDIVVSYTISSLDGKILEQKVGLNRAAFNIEMQHFLQGMYIITIQTESDTRSAKIIKK